MHTPSPTSKSSGFPFLDSLVPSYLSIDTEGRVIRLDTVRVPHFLVSLESGNRNLPDQFKKDGYIQLVHLTNVVVVLQNGCSRL
jgi:hypothetical protein